MLCLPQNVSQSMHIAKFHNIVKCISLEAFKLPKYTSFICKCHLPPQVRDIKTRFNINHCFFSVQQPSLSNFLYHVSAIRKVVDRQCVSRFLLALFFITLNLLEIFCVDGQVKRWNKELFCRATNLGDSRSACMLKGLSTDYHSTVLFIK